MDEDDGMSFLESLASATPGVAPDSDSAEDVPESPSEAASSAEAQLAGGEPWWRRQDESATGWNGPDDGPMPTRPVGLSRVEVPDLARINRRRWPEVLQPLSQQDRMAAALHPLVPDGAAFELAKRLPPAASEAAWAAVSGSPGIPVPGAKAPPAGRQVNVRLPDDDWQAVQRAAHVLGLRPAQLTRMLVCTGVRRVLAEHDAAMAAAARFEAPVRSSGVGGS